MCVRSCFSFVDVFAAQACCHHDQVESYDNNDGYRKFLRQGHNEDFARIAGSQTLEPFACRHLPNSEGGGVPKPIVFMLDNKLYLHPSLASNGDHEDKPDHLDHLGNGKAWKQWGSLVYLHAGLSR